MTYLRMGLHQADCIFIEDPTVESEASSISLSFSLTARASPPIIRPQAAQKIAESADLLCSEQVQNRRLF